MLPNIFTNLPTLETERLILRKLLYSDKSDIFEYAQNPEVAKYVLWYPHRNESDSLEYLNIIYEEYRNNRPAPWGIELKETKKIIGTVGFLNWDDFNNHAEVGFVLSNNYWNNGLASEAVKRVIEFGFFNMLLNRIEARCNQDNVGSKKLLEKLGFKFEGVLRKQLLIKGNYEDMKLFSLIRSEKV